MSKLNWVNLSKRKFESRKYENPEAAGGVFLKPRCGLWFSLKTDYGNESEWGDFLEYNTSLQKNIKDEDGSTFVTEASLKDSVFVLDLDLYKDDIIDVIENSKDIQDPVQKRKMLLDKIKSITKRDDISYIVLELKEKDLSTILDIYKNHVMNEDQKRQYKFGQICGNLINKIKSPEIDSDAFESILLSNADTKLDDEKNLDNKLLKEELIEFREFIKNIKSKDDLISISNYSRYVDNSIAINWITDYFSGMYNLELIDGYDMPSLVLFDTDAVDVKEERKVNLFEKDKIVSSKDVGEFLLNTSRFSIQEDVMKTLILNKSKDDKDDQR